MPVLKREFASLVKGGHMENEDWWRLVLDTDTGRIYVEHEMSHTDVWGRGGGKAGTWELDINEYLANPESRQRSKLIEVLSTLFPTAK